MLSKADREFYTLVSLIMDSDKPTVEIWDAIEELKHAWLMLHNHEQ